MSKDCNSQAYRLAGRRRSPLKLWHKSREGWKFKVKWGHSVHESCHLETILNLRKSVKGIILWSVTLLNQLGSACHFFPLTQTQGSRGFYFKIKISIKSSHSYLHTYIFNALFKETNNIVWGTDSQLSTLQAFCMTYGQMLCDTSWRAEIAQNNTWASIVQQKYESLAPNAHYHLTQIFPCLSFPFRYSKGNNIPPSERADSRDTTPMLI